MLSLIEGYFKNDISWSTSAVFLNNEFVDQDYDYNDDDDDNCKAAC